MPTSGWSSGWATPARRTPATGTTSATWSSTSWPPGSARAVQAAQGRARRRRRGPARRRPGGRPASCCAAAALLHERVRRARSPALTNFYKVPVERLIVVHDELDIPFGTLRLKLGGGDNGHNGLRSIRTLAGHRRLLPGAGRHRPAPGPAGRRPTSCSRTSPTRAQGAAVPGRTGPPTPSSRCSPRAWSGPRTCSTAEARSGRPAGSPPFSVCKVRLR